MGQQVIEMGKRGFTLFADTQIRKQEFRRNMELERLELRYKRELDFQKSVVKLGFAWNILQLDLNSFSKRYLNGVVHGREAPDAQEFITPLKRSTKFGNIIMKSTVEKSILTELLVGESQAGFLGDIYRIKAVSPDPEDMILQTRRHNEIEDSFRDVCSALEMDADRNWIEAKHFTINADSLHDYLYKAAK
jgi:hypothetical protein